MADFLWTIEAEDGEDANPQTVGRIVLKAMMPSVPRVGEELDANGQLWVVESVRYTICDWTKSSKMKVSRFAMLACRKVQGTKYD
jgi:hypothetical protein